MSKDMLKSFPKAVSPWVSGDAVVSDELHFGGLRLVSAALTSLVVKPGQSLLVTSTA